MSSSPGKKPPRDREAIDLALDLRDALVAIHPDSAHLKQLEATNRESDLFEAELQLIRPGRFRGYQRQTNHRPFELPESRSGDLDRPVADASDDIDGAAEGLNVPADDVHLGDLTVLDCCAVETAILSHGHGHTVLAITNMPRRLTLITAFRSWRAAVK